MSNAMRSAALAALVAADVAIAADIPTVRGEEVVVTARRFPEPVGHTPVNISVISAEEIGSSTARTVPERSSERFRTGRQPRRI